MFLKSMLCLIMLNLSIFHPVAWGSESSENSSQFFPQNLPPPCEEVFSPDQLQALGEGKEIELQDVENPTSHPVRVRRSSCTDIKEDYLKVGAAALCLVIVIGAIFTLPVTLCCIGADGKLHYDSQ